MKLLKMLFIALILMAKSAFANVDVDVSSSLLPQLCREIDDKFSEL